MAKKSTTLARRDAVGEIKNYLLRPIVPNEKEISNEIPLV